MHLKSLKVQSKPVLATFDVTVETRAQGEPLTLTVRLDGCFWQ